MDLPDIVEVDLRKDDLLLHAQRIVAAAVKALVRKSTEVANTRRSDVDEAIQEFEHMRPTQGDPCTDRHTFAQLEVGDGLSGTRNVWPLAGIGI